MGAAPDAGAACCCPPARARWCSSARPMALLRWLCRGGALCFLGTRSRKERRAMLRRCAARARLTLWRHAATPQRCCASAHARTHAVAVAETARALDRTRARSGRLRVEHCVAPAVFTCAMLQQQQPCSLHLCCVVSCCVAAVPCAPCARHVSADVSVLLCVRSRLVSTRSRAATQPHARAGISTHAPFTALASTPAARTLSVHHPSAATTTTACTPSSPSLLPSPSSRSSH
jgi:hypothetical protein